MSNNKQSSIEWFKKELEDYGTSERVKIDWKTFDELFEQAKAMHKEEIINATIYGDRFEGCYGLDSEQYYAKIFGGNK